MSLGNSVEEFSGLTLQPNLTVHILNASTSSGTSQTAQFARGGSHAKFLFCGRTVPGALNVDMHATLKSFKSSRDLQNEAGHPEKCYTRKN